MNPEDPQATQTINEKNSNKTVLLVLSMSIIVVLVIGSVIFVLAKKTPTKPVNYTNPFSTQSQTQNPFAKPTTAFQNPFVQPTQTTNKSYQNPFGGGQ